jgi:hypothetical protein
MSKGIFMIYIFLEDYTVKENATLLRVDRDNSWSISLDLCEGLRRSLSLSSLFSPPEAQSPATPPHGRRWPPSPPSFIIYAPCHGGLLPSRLPPRHRGATSSVWGCDLLEPELMPSVRQWKIQASTRRIQARAQPPSCAEGICLVSVIEWQLRWINIWLSKYTCD